MGRRSLVDPYVLGAVLDAGAKGATVAEIVASLPALNPAGVVKSLQRLVERERIIRREEYAPLVPVVSSQGIQIQAQPRRFRYWSRTYRAFIPSPRLRGDVGQT